MSKIICLTSVSRQKKDYFVSLVIDIWLHTYIYESTCLTTAQKEKIWHIRSVKAIVLRTKILHAEI